MLHFTWQSRRLPAGGGGSGSSVRAGGMQRPDQTPRQPTSKGAASSSSLRYRDARVYDDLEGCMGKHAHELLLLEAALTHRTKIRPRSPGGPALCGGCGVFKR